MTDQVQDPGVNRGPKRGTPWSGLQDEPRTTPVRPIPAREIKSLSPENSQGDRFAKAFDQRMVTEDDVLAYIRLWVNLGYVSDNGYPDIDAICLWTGFYKAPVANRAVHPSELTVKEMRDIVTKDMTGPKRPAPRLAPAPAVVKPSLMTRLANRAKKVKQVTREL